MNKSRWAVVYHRYAPTPLYRRLAATLAAVTLLVVLFGIPSPREVKRTFTLLMTDQAVHAAEPVHHAAAEKVRGVPALMVRDEIVTSADESNQVLESSDAQAVPATDSPAQPMFNGRPIRPVRTIEMTVTAYSPDERSCGKWADGFTASGYSVWTNAMRLVAADTSMLPFGTIVTIPDYHDGTPVPVLDRGGKIKGNRLDVLYPTHERALQWGVKKMSVIVWEYAD